MVTRSDGGQKKKYTTHRTKIRKDPGQLRCPLYTLDVPQTSWQGQVVLEMGGGRDLRG